MVTTACGITSMKIWLPTGPVEKTTICTMPQPKWMAVGIYNDFDLAYPNANTIPIAPVTKNSVIIAEALPHNSCENQ